MARRRFTPEQLDWLRQAYQVSRVPELTRRFNRRWESDRTEGQIKQALLRHGIRCGRRPGLTVGEAPREYDDAKLAWLREHRPQLRIRELTARFNRRFGCQVSEAALATRCKYYGISAGRTGQFAAGQRPWNKGRPMQVTGRMADSQFQAGNLPHTHVPIGTYTRDSHTGRWKLKVADDQRPGYSRHNWRYVTRLTWEAAHGPIPPHHVVMVLDGDEDHCLDLDNLLCVPRATLVRAISSGYSQLPPDRDLRRAALLEAQLRQRAHERVEQLGISRAAKRALMQPPCS